MEILIADDDFVARGMLRKMLERLGHTVVSAENGREAWEKICARKNRMVITDWEMPELNGLELCRKIRENQNQCYVFIFLLTAGEEKENIIVGLKAGADDYLTKPFSQAEFIARLNTGLRVLDLETSLQKANEEIRLLSLTDSLTGFEPAIPDKRVSFECLIKRADEMLYVSKQQGRDRVTGGILL